MATRAQKAKVGLFVLVCALLAAAGILLLSRYNFEERIRYWAEFDESILGLGKDGLVVYLGVPVGKVHDVYVTPKNVAHVEIEIIPKKVTLKEGVTAQLNMYSLATGTMCVSLKGGDPDGDALRPGAQIPTQQSLVESVSTQIDDILKNLRVIADTVKNGLSGMGQGDIALLVEDADGLLVKGREFLDEANKAIIDVKRDAATNMAGFNGLVEDVRKLVRDTNVAVKTATHKLEVLKVSETEEKIDGALSEITALSKRLQDSAGSLDKVSRSAMHEVDNVQYSMRETLKTLNDSLEAVKGLTTYLQQDPSALLRGKAKKKGEE